jgi:hypothetical protein
VSAERPSLRIADVDVDGALVEAAASVTGVSRASFLARAALGSSSVVALLAGRAQEAAAATRGDVAILNFALVLEYLQAAFYTEAERRKLLGGKLAVIPPHLGAVERAHVAAFRKVLGSAAVKRPTFDFRGTTEQADPFLRTAVALEDLAVAAYKGQAGNISSPAYLAAAISIHSVEARHAAWMRYLLGRKPAASALDKPVTAAVARRLVASTHFVVAKAKTSARKPPPYTG